MGYGGFGLVVVLGRLDDCGGVRGGGDMLLGWLYGCSDVFSVVVSISIVSTGVGIRLGL